MMLYMPQSLKMCSKCGEWKLNATQWFYGRGKRLDAHCKECRRARRQQHYQENRERVNEQKRQHYQENREHFIESARQYYRENRDSARTQMKHHYVQRRDTALEYARSYRAANKEKVAEDQRRYYQQNKERLQKQNRRYGRENRESIAQHNRQKRQTQKYKQYARAAHAKRKAHKLAVGSTHTAADIQRQYDAQQGRCYYCEAEVGEKYHIDHYIPLSKGGSNGAENIVIACPTCNLRKTNKMPDVFLAELRHINNDD